MELEPIDESLLNLLQQNFPVEKRPFRLIADKLKITEAQCLARIKYLKEKHFIRFLGAIIDTKNIGFESALIAFKTSSSKTEHIAKMINTHPGVTHNYQRDSEYNLWFTLATPASCDFQKHLDSLLHLSKPKDYLYLPNLKTYKIRMVLNCSSNGNNIIMFKTQNGYCDNHLIPYISIEINALEKEILQFLQHSIPIISQPFNELAIKLNLSHDYLLTCINNLASKGIIRRFGAIVSHRKIGYTYNVMALWNVTQARINSVAKQIASCQEVSHCYQRTSYSDWPYSIYSMIHAKSKDSADKLVSKLINTNQIDQYKLLVTVKEFKKQRLEYFTDKFVLWEIEHQIERQ